VVRPAGERPYSFAGGDHDRWTHRREDTAWLDEQWGSARSAIVVVGDGDVAMDGDRLRLVTPAQAPPGERALLGEVGGRTYFAVMAAEVPTELSPEPVRAAGGRLDAVDGGLLVHAVALDNWHRTHPRCSRCGAPTVTAQAGHVRRCPTCQALHFPRTDPAVIMLVTDGRDRALLGRQRAWPPQRYSTLAGFVEPGEALEDAVRREVAEEVSISVGEVTYAGSQPWPFPSSLMVGFFAAAESEAISVDGDEIADARWFTRDDLTALTGAGAMTLPGPVSISRWLIDTWHTRAGHGAPPRQQSAARRPLRRPTAP
jgi:NAD+ diphosphatase